MQSNGLRLPYYYSLPPSSVTEQDSLSLWFLVHGDPAPPAEVNIRFCHRIDGLKEAINEKRIRLGYQLVPGMVLWKVKTPIPLYRRTGAERIAFTRKIEDLNFPDPESDEGFEGSGPVQLLDEVEDVSHYWEKSPQPKHLHIVVQAPSVSKPSKTRFEDETDASIDLCALWEQTWDRKDEDIPWFALTEASRDGTLKVPVSVPEHFWVFSPPDTIAQTLKLDPQTVLVREDYSRALRQMFKSSGWSNFTSPTRGPNSGTSFYNPFTRAKPPHKPSRIGFVLTGPPGIGKSIWLRILLVLRLCARLPTFYQISNSRAVLFTKKGAVVVRLDSDTLGHYTKEERTAWALVDSTPPSKFIDTGIFVVHTLSHHSDHIEKSVGGEVCRLALWSPAEIICAAPFQRIRHKEQSLIEFCKLYGWSAGDVYSKAKEFDRRLDDTNRDASKLSPTSSAPPSLDDETIDENVDESEEGSEASECDSEGPAPTLRRSERKPVKTEKVLEVSGNKGKVTKPTGKYLPYDPSRHSSWAKKCNHCAISDTKCFGPVYLSDGTLSSSVRCHKCALGHHRCEKGIFRKPTSPIPSGETIFVRPRVVPPADRPSTPIVRSVVGSSARETSSSTVAVAGKRQIRMTPKLAAAKMQAIELGTPASRKRPAVAQPVDNAPSPSKFARTSKTSLIPRHTGTDTPSNSYHIPPRTNPSRSHSNSKPPRDNPNLIRLNEPETSIFSDQEDQLRRLADVRRLYHKVQQNKRA